MTVRGGSLVPNWSTKWGRAAYSFVILSTVSCDGTSASPPALAPPVAVSVVVVSPSTTSVVEGQTAQATATLKDVAGNILVGRGLSWGSSDPTIASVNGDGLIQAVSAGITTVSAFSEGRSGNALVTVTRAPASSIEIALPSVLVVGRSAQLAAIVRDVRGRSLTGRAVEWRSSDPTILSISDSGLLQGISEGAATIIAVTEGKSGGGIVTVISAPVGSVEVIPSSVTLPVGQMTTLVATLRDVDGRALNGRSVSWGTSNPGIASVSGTGVVQGVQEGSAIIVASSGGRTALASVSITRADISTLELTPISGTLVIGETLQFSVNARDASGNALAGRAVSWMSSNPSAVTISSVGLAQAVTEGFSTIRAIVEGKTASAVVSVSAPRPGRLSVTVTGLPGATSATIEIVDPNGLQQIRSSSASNPLVLNGVPAGTYRLRTSPAVVTTAGVGYTYEAINNPRVVVLPNGGNEAANFDFRLTSGVVALDATGVPVGSQHQCNVIFPGGFSSFAWRTPDGRPAASMVPVGTVQMQCGEIRTSGGILYDPSPATQAITVMASMTPVVAAVRYAPRIAASNPSLTISATGLPSSTTNVSVEISDPNGLQQTRSFTPENPIGLTGLAPGNYRLRTLGAAADNAGLTYTYEATNNPRVVTVPSIGGAVTTFDFRLASGVVALQVSGVPSGLDHQCSVIFSGGFSSFAWRTSDGRPAASMVPVGTAQVQCGAIRAAGGIVYDPSPSMQTISISASFIPTTVVVRYAPR